MKLHKYTQKDIKLIAPYYDNEMGVMRTLNDFLTTVTILKNSLLILHSIENLNLQVNVDS